MNLDYFKDYFNTIPFPPDLHPVEWGIAGVFVTSLLIQLIYFFFLFARLAFYKRPESTMGTKLPAVSVIVAAHNEEENLKKLLPALLSQQYPDFEVIVVDDRSHDESWQVLYETRQLDPRLRVINIFEKPEEINGKKFALTLAIKAAKNDLLLFTDADCEPPGKEWIRSMTAQFGTDKQFVLGYSQYQKLPGLLNLLIRFETFYTAVQYLSFALAGRPYMGVGRNLAYRKSLFMGAKGFYKHNAVTGGDDDLLVNRLATGANTAISVGQDSNTLSIPKTSWKAWYRQKKRHLAVGKLYKGGDRVLLGILAVSHVLFWIAGLILCLLSARGDLQILLFSVLLGFIFRWTCFGVLLAAIRRKLGDQINLVLLPFLDLLYIIYYIVIGFAAATSKKVKWK